MFVIFILIIIIFMRSIILIIFKSFMYITLYTIQIVSEQLNKQENNIVSVAKFIKY